ncbi:MAG: hypothetical protein ABIY52_17025 [Gemmatimonadaceae bacterium]
MISRRAAIQGTIVGTVLQVAMVVAGHSMPTVAEQFAPVGMAISLVAGLVYSRIAEDRGLRSLALGGLIAGGLCALIGIVVSYLLGDVPAAIIALGTCGSAVTGAIGGAAGKLMFGPKGVTA